MTNEYLWRLIYIYNIYKSMHFVILSLVDYVLMLMYICTHTCICLVCSRSSSSFSKHWMPLSETCFWCWKISIWTTHTSKNYSICVSSILNKSYFGTERYEFKISEENEYLNFSKSIVGTHLQEFFCGDTHSFSCTWFQLCVNKRLSEGSVLTVGLHEIVEAQHVHITARLRSASSECKQSKC